MKDFKVGLQLFSVRDAMSKDIHKTLKAVKDMGYDYVELAGYYDMEAEQLRRLLDEYGLKAVSTHEGYEEIINNTDKKINDLKTLGLKYFAVPWMGLDKHKGSENFEKTVLDFKKAGEILKNNGIKFLYHNHAHEFTRYEKKFVLEWLLEEVGDILSPEIDVCWVHYAGYKPEDYILKYKGRLPVLHLKDFMCMNMPEGPVYTDEEADEPKYPDREKVGLRFRPVGYGVQDIPAILKAAEETDTEYIIVEDEVNDMDSLESVKMSREYLKSLGI